MRKLIQARNYLAAQREIKLLDDYRRKNHIKKTSDTYSLIEQQKKEIARHYHQ